MPISRSSWLERRCFDTPSLYDPLFFAFHDIEAKASISSHIDVDLLRACAACAALWIEYRKIADAGTAGTDDESRNLLLTGLWNPAQPLLERVSNLYAATIDGHRARAAILLAWHGAMLVSEERSGNRESRLTLALAQDLVVHCLS